MNKLMKLSVATTLALTTFLGTSFVTHHSENANASSIYSSCKSFNTVYPHGVKLSSNTKNKVHKRGGGIVYRYSAAKVSPTIYKKAMKYNSDLDRDNDHIACER